MPIQDKRILVADDDAIIRSSIREYFEGHGALIIEASCCAELTTAFHTSSFDIALLDYEYPDGVLLDLLPQLREAAPDVPVVVLTGHGSIDLAVKAITLGASNFLTKPVELSALHVVISRLIESRDRTRREGAREARLSRQRANPFLGKSSIVREFERQARKLLPSDATVLIQGETGTGKGTLAGWFHRNGPRASGPLVSVNCAGLSHSLLESELFGHERGAFTGAVSAKTGLFEAAHQGTLVLDEVGDMDIGIQPKLLTVLEEQRFRRLGSLRERAVSIRLIAATNQSLQQLVRDKLFRSDLYFRIATLPLMVPPLRERREDIPLLARWLLDSLADELSLGGVSISAAALRALEQYDWPGNIRELRNVLERALLLSDGSALDRADLFFEAEGMGAARVDVALTLAEVERNHIAAVLDSQDGHVQNTAQVLGIPRSTLYSKLSRYGLGQSRPL